MTATFESVNRSLRKQGKEIVVCFEGQPGAFYQIVERSTELQVSPDFDTLDQAVQFIADCWS